MGSKMGYKEDAIQNFCDSWWIIDDSSEISRGRLIWTFLPHIDQIPYRLVIESRQEATNHKNARFKMEPLRIKQPQKKNPLPVAAASLFKGEVS